MRTLITALILTAAASGAQDIKFPASFDKLAEKAEDVVDVNLDANMLGLASQFLSEQKTEERQAKGIVQGLKGIYVRSFEFSQEGQYTQADLDEIRAQLRPPEWVSIVNVRSKKEGEKAQIYIKKEGDKVAGLTILAAEPKNLTIVHIVGTINPSDLAKFSGSFGIPNIQMGPAEKEEEKK